MSNFDVIDTSHQYICYLILLLLLFSRPLLPDLSLKLLQVRVLLIFLAIGLSGQVLVEMLQWVLKAISC